MRAPTGRVIMASKPPFKLTTRKQVKMFLNMAKADALRNEMLDAMIDQVSAEAMEITNRKFDYRQRVEYHQSYEQGMGDPVPQYIFPMAPPIDVEKPIRLSWSATHQYQDTELEISTPDIVVSSGLEAIIVRVGALTYNPNYLSYYSGTPAIGYSPMGFKLDYFGGFPTENEVEEIPEDADPLDEYNVIQVPLGMSTVLARKIAEDYGEKGYLRAWTVDDKQALIPYRRKNICP